MNRLLTAVLGVLLLPGTLTISTPMKGETRQNPFMVPYDTPFEIPPFDKITYDDYLPATREGIARQRAEIEAIANNPATPTFDNTILAMEKSGELLNKVVLVFSALDETDNNNRMTEISEELYPMVSAASDEIMMNDKLFQRIKYLYDHRDQLGLNEPQKRAVELSYKSFTRNGALLDEEGKEQLKQLNNTLTQLYLTFNKNLLAATNAFQLTVNDPARLSGIPASTVAAAAEEAKNRGKEGQWVFTLHAPSRLPVLQYADNRDLRKAMYEGYINLASSGQYNNIPVIQKIIALRDKKAKLMGFDNFAQMMTSRVMAKTPEAAEQLLMQVFTPAVKRSHEEVADMQALVDAEGGDFKIAPWDYYYYAEKVKKQKYDFDEGDVRPYFSLENVLNGLFGAAERLYGIKMVEIPDAPKYMDQVTVYDVQDAATGEHISVFMTDFFPRSTKRQGAWMEQMQAAGEYEGGVMKRPIVYNVGNFTPPSADTPALLTLDEVETTFHEFGHALQGMLTRAPYKSLAGTNVDRDYVEMSSQMNEHFAFTPEMLKSYARHYKTGEVIPDSLIQKLEASSKFNQGFATTELAGAALLDLEWGKQHEDDIDVVAFEKKVADKIGMPEEITFRYRSPYFKHIFGDDGYASGYYTYLWSQVLEADAWELFEQNGVFDPATAASYKKNILESGDTEDALVLFENFRGHKPDAKALLRLRGLE